MLKWIRGKCTKSGESVKLDTNQCMHVMASEIKDLKERVELLEMQLRDFVILGNNTAKVETKPAPKRVGRPKKYAK